MIKHIPFASLYTANHGWLQSHFHFSFAEYHNPYNQRFGVLRVMNDDIIQSKKGFGEHPHRDMEIITYILHGELTHMDSMGHKESLGRGSMQYLSAGTGITHSEMNDSNEAVHLIQTWIMPREKGLKPQYGSKTFHEEERLNQWLYLVGPEGSGASIYIYQDASMYVCELEDKKKITFDLNTHRQLYVKLMEGSAMINSIAFASGDAAELKDENLHIESVDNAHLLVIEMPNEVQV